MPSSIERRTAGLLPVGALPILGSEFPRPNNHMIASWSPECLGWELGGMTTAFASGTYTTASTAIAIPLVITHPFVVRKVFWHNGTTATADSADVGVYTEAGARLVSGGGTAISGATSVQEVDVTDTALKPGRYWLAYVQNGTTATPVRCAFGSAAVARMIGSAGMASAYPLPSTFTFAAATILTLPMFGIAARTLVA